MTRNDRQERWLGWVLKGIRHENPGETGLEAGLAGKFEKGQVLIIEKNNLDFLSPFRSFPAPPAIDSNSDTE